MTQTITRLYDTYTHAQEAVRALKQAGLTDDDISIVANRGTDADLDEATDAGEGAGVGAGIGGVVGGGAGLLAGLGIMAIPGIGPVVAAGWLAATALGAVAGAVAGGATGGIIGSLTGNGVPENDAHVYAEGVRRGGSLVTARVPDDREVEVNRILSSHPGVDVTERGAEYRKAGWQRFEETAAPYDSAARRR